MKKINLENLKVISFVTTISASNSKTIKGGGLTDELPACNPNETNDCTGETYTCTNTDVVATCNGQSGSVERACGGTANANCPRTGQAAGTIVGCTEIC